MINYLPEHLRTTEVIEIMNALSKVNDELKVDVLDLEKQMFVSSATWGLTLFENMLDITTNYSLSYDERRMKILSKLRATGTTTKQMICNISNAYTNGTTSVTEHFSDYAFTINFINGSLPEILNDFLEQINEVKPAHLNFNVNAKTDINISTYVGAFFTRNYRKEVILIE